MIAWRCALVLPLLATAAAPAADAAQQQHAAAQRQQQQPYHGTTVHIVFSSHLDVGFTAWDNATLNDYFHSHLPRAVWLAEWQRLSGSRDAFVFTTHAWLLALFLDCPASLGVICPSAAQQAALLAAMRAGTITWHAAPFNLQFELLPDAQQLAAALDISRRLDELTGTRRKIVVSLRDVPGLTRGALPVMAAAGVRALSVGVNAGSAPPGVPLDTPFIWRDMASNASLLAMWHAGGYGGTCRDAASGVEVVIGCRQDCVAVPGLAHVMCYSWRADNQGPTSSAADVQAVFDVARQQWPGAAVKASSLEAFVEQLEAALAAGRLTLPVVTGEIGDTWVYGAAADPRKLAAYRAAARARRAWAAQQQHGASPTTPTHHRHHRQLARFDLLAIKCPEHTAGLDLKSTMPHFADGASYTNARLHACMDAAAASAAAGLPASAPAADPPGCEGTSRIAHSWQRQAQYVEWAMQELPGDHPIVTAFRADMRQLAGLAAEAAAPRGELLLPAPPPSRRTAGADVPPQLLLFAAGTWLVGVHPHTGAIARLCRTRGAGGRCGLLPAGAAPACAGNDWAAPPGGVAAGGGGGFGSILYVVHRAADYEVLWQEYAWEGPPNTNPWFQKDIGRAGLNESFWDKHVEAQPRFTRLHHTCSAAGGLRLSLHYELPPGLTERAGAPRHLALLLSTGEDGSGGASGGDAASDDGLRLSLVWRGKPATRLPEALWLRFAPAPHLAVDPTSWRLHKLGAAIDPAEVLLNGSRSLHAVDDVTGVTVAAPHSARGGGAQRLAIRPRDAPLVSPGVPTVLPNVRHPPDMEAGVSFLLHDNLWSTNYAEWLPYLSPQSCDKRRAPQQQPLPRAGGGGAAGGLLRRVLLAAGNAVRRIGMPLPLPRQPPSPPQSPLAAGRAPEAVDAELSCELSTQRTMVFRFDISTRGEHVEDEPEHGKDEE